MDKQIRWDAFVATAAEVRWHMFRLGLETEEASMALRDFGAAMEVYAGEPAE